MSTTTLHPVPAATADEIAAMDAWWRANNYLTIGHGDQDEKTEELMGAVKRLLRRG